MTASVTFLTHQETEVDEEKFEIPEDYKLIVARDRKKQQQQQKAATTINNKDHDSETTTTITARTEDEDRDATSSSDDEREYVDVEEYLANAEREELERGGDNDADEQNE